MMARKMSNCNRMSGLVSKWATDDDLVRKAKTQDHISSSQHKAWTSEVNTNARPKSSPGLTLESKWASSNDEPENSTSKNKLKPRNPPHPRHQSHKRNSNHNKQQLPTPPGSKDDESDEEVLPPMTEGAKALAARIGIVDNTISKPPKPQTHYHHIQLDSLDEELPPMTEGAKQLAARLLLPDQQNKPRGKPNRKKQPTKTSDQRAKEAKQLEEQNTLLEEEKAKVQMEIDKIIKEMEDPNLSWADID